MECLNCIESELVKGDISKLLFKGSAEKELITELQKTLFELGFRKELNWDKFQADGIYGRATTAAVLAFAQKNKQQTDGTSVSNQLYQLIQQRHDFLPSMYILWQIQKSDLRSKLFLSKGSRMSIIAIQVLLNELGYGNQLNFAKFGADGIYGKNTRKAVITFTQDNGVVSDGDLLTRPLVDLLIKKINTFYGNSWSDLAKNNLPNETSPLRLFEGSRFKGAPCRADVHFVAILEKINSYAEQAEVFIHVTSSFRTTTNVRGAIVKPARFSNHLAGHGLDINLIHGNNDLADSVVLTNYPNVPEPVKRFLKFIIDDPELRWGGQFRSKDPVHIDDGLFQKDKNMWQERYEAMQRAVQLGA